MNERLKTIRERLKKTLKDVEAETGIENSHYSMMERGKRKVTDRTVKLLASVYGVDENWLRTGEGEMFSPPAPASQLQAPTFNLDATVDEFVALVAKMPREMQELIAKIGLSICDKLDLSPLGACADGTTDKGNSQQN